MNHKLTTLHRSAVEISWKSLWFYIIKPINAGTSLRFFHRRCGCWTVQIFVASGKFIILNRHRALTCVQKLFAFKCRSVIMFFNELAPVEALATSPTPACIRRLETFVLPSSRLSTLKCATDQASLCLLLSPARALVDIIPCPGNGFEGCLCDGFYHSNSRHLSSRWMS